MKKIIGLLIIPITTVLTFLTTPALAATDIPTPCDKGWATNCPNLDDSTSLEKTIGEVIRFVLIAAGVLAVIMIIWGGFRITTSGGNAETVKEGRRIIMFSIIGLALAALAGVIVAIVFSAVDETFLP